MRKLICSALLLMLAAPSAFAQEKPSVRFSFGYAYAEYLEEGGGAAPVGVYFSVASAASYGLEGEIAYHRDEEEFFNTNYVLNTFTAMVGPRFGYTTGKAQPFGHVLGGVRYDSFEGEGNGSVSLEAGGGVDVQIGPGAYLRFGADFQMFFDDGEDFKVLRLTAGITL